ncbi:TonB-dependent receptor plug domain-containing protein [Alkalimonas mucilaginosa]|uniref:TonB-dependent receptor n=1 Tax=Alkalimonas mucilaginosa TaxID=3057676 RepID=A0ABU7JD73_9GAMM|nr:TonB-dependent receptor [Alkalimonas sp. MEB004]MEE2023636.1 TonB-dependent receptor [Alkalimonas sp. MEB004]
MQTKNYSRLSTCIRCAIAGVTTLALTAPVWANTEEQTQAAAQERVERIAVVGSRSAPRSVADSPVPVDIIGGDELMKSGSTDMLNMMTATVPSMNVHSHPISDAATLIRPLNLRGLSSDSTLILVNGKRRHRSAVITMLGGGLNDGAQGPDISAIPGAAIKQVEILRDGAAAQYGSDAIAGVVNFVLNDRDEGGHIEVRRGEFYAGDGTSNEINANIGLPLTDAGFFNISAQYKASDATSRSTQHAGAVNQVAYGNPNISIDQPVQVWGSPKISDDIAIFANAGLDLGNGREAYLFGNYSERDVMGGFYFRDPYTRNQVFSNDGGQTLIVANTDFSQGDCPVVSLADPTFSVVNAQVQALPAHCFTFFSWFPGGFTPSFGGNITDTSLVGGTKGEFQSGFLAGTMYDFSATVGRSEAGFKIINTVNSTLGPDSPTEFDPGRYIQLEKHFNADFYRFVPVGLYEDLAVAGGLQWSEESFEIVAGETASWEVGPYVEQGLDFIGSNGYPGFSPDAAGVFVRRHWAAYLDVEAEVTEHLLAGFALRHEDYETFGTTTNFKLTGQYRLTDDFAIRASTSTGFRAPTVGQANISTFRTATDDAGNLVDIALLAPSNPVAQLYGATELTPETSKSYTLGLVYSGNSFFMTADAYRIDIDDRLSQSDTINIDDTERQRLRDLGFKGVEGLSQLNFYTNDFSTRTTGLDIVMNYGTALLSGRSTFSLAYNWNKTEVTRFSDITGAFKVSRLEKDLPKQRATLTWSQEWNDISMFLRSNYYGSYQGVHFDTIAKQASSKVTFDLEVNYAINDAFSVAVGAQNLFDTKPERVDYTDTGFPQDFLGGKYYETSPMGINGGFWYLRGRYSF